MKIKFALLSLAFALSTIFSLTAFAADDPLPSWNDTAAKQAIVSFVEKVNNTNSPDFVPVPERIATFDNDGTLWCEQPIYFQFQFALDRVKALAPQHPEWKTQAPFSYLLAGDMKKFMAGGEKSLLQVLVVSHSGMTTDEYDKIVKDWLATARHPRFNQPYDSLVYQPMLELLAYLRTNGFKTFIVSGGGVVKFEMRDGKPVLVKEAKVEFIDDGPGKPLGINHFIGRRPIMAFGNSDGDQ
jgi:haloacid dehalogenase-like hydrolase